MLPNRVVALFAALLLPVLSFAQNGKITGRLADGKNNPISYATVVLMKADSSVLDGATSADNGSFEIDAPAPGSYLLKVSAIGAAPRFIGDINISPETPGKDVGVITLSFTTQNLDEVQIVSEKSVMEMYVDKKVFNVDKNITTAGGSATDVLSNVPSVSVDVDGSVSLRGKGNVTILIDGKPATLLGSDVNTALQSLPAASIDNIEVITNPGAKYDAQGVTGIINIVTKRDKKFGFNGSVNAGAGTRDKYNGGLNLNAKNTRWNVFLNSNFRNNRNYNRNSNGRDNFNSALYYRGADTGTRTFTGWFNSLGAEYIINKNNTLTLTQNVNYMRWGNKGVSYFGTYADSLNQPLALRQRFSESRGGPLSFATNLDYKHKFRKEKQEITSSINYANSAMKHRQQYNTYDAFDPADGNYHTNLYENTPGEGGNSSLNAQADFTTPFALKNGKLDAGWKTQLFWFRSANRPTITNRLTGVESFNPVLYNDYYYRQQNHAAYASFADQQGKFSYMAGLRLEYTGYDGNVRRGDTTQPYVYYTNNFLNLFPSVFLSYKLPKDQSVYLNFSRRINRPSFWNLMPFVDLSNPQDTSMGNPNLKPEFIYNAELNYNRMFKKGHNFMTSAYYQYTSGMIERYRRFYSDGTSFSQPQNLATGLTYGLELIGRMQLLPIWDATVNFNLFRNEVRGTNIAPELNNSGTAWFTKANTNIRLPKGFSLQLNGNYESPKVLAQGKLQEVYWVDIALRKNFFNNKATLVLNVSDVFDTRKYSTDFLYDTYLQTSYRDRETRIGNISFTYRFGKSDSGTGPAKPTESKRPKTREKKEEKPVEKDRNNLRGDESEGGGSGGPGK
ncbi:MAG: TonB-dependent receptor [Flavipsychrobacter sp.]|nr:TonB-dependent receptor [Flavipsychrobacter sp.]